jgi:hypothetical protein
MKHVIVRYELEPGREAENEELVRAVYAQLERDRPPGIRYATYVLPDGVSFLHVATLAADANPLPTLEAFRAFTAGIAERCVKPPVTEVLRLVGAYPPVGP